MKAKAIDVQIGHWLVVGDVARRVTGVEVHSKRGDGLADGDVRIIMGDVKVKRRHDRTVTVLMED